MQRSSCFRLRSSTGPNVLTFIAPHIFLPRRLYGSLRSRRAPLRRRRLDSSAAARRRSLVGGPGLLPRLLHAGPVSAPYREVDQRRRAKRWHPPLIPFSRRVSPTNLGSGYPALTSFHTEITVRFTRLVTKKGDPQRVALARSAMCTQISVHTSRRGHDQIRGAPPAQHSARTAAPARPAPRVGIGVGWRGNACVLLTATESNSCRKGFQDGQKRQT